MYSSVSILLVYDLLERATELSNSLKTHYSFNVFTAHSKWGLVNQLNNHYEQIQLVLIDINKDVNCGASYCTVIRNNNFIDGLPILYIVNRDNENCKIKILNSGADAYITNPNSIELIKARIDSLIRQRNKSKSLFHYKELLFNSDKRILTIHGENIALTATEYMIAELMFMNPHKVFSRDDILDRIYPDDHLIYRRTIDGHIKNIRKKLGSYHKLIHTNIKHGYGIKIND